MIVLDFLRMIVSCIFIAMLQSLFVIYTLLLPIIAMIICVVKNLTIDDSFAMAFKYNRIIAKTLIEISERL